MPLGKQSAKTSCGADAMKHSPEEHWTIDDNQTKSHWLVTRDQDGWWEAVCKWDGCVDLQHFGNIPYDEDPERENPQCCDDYIHVCDLKEYVERLQALLTLAQDFFGDEDAWMPLPEPPKENP